MKHPIRPAGSACMVPFRPAGEVSPETSSKLWAVVALGLLVGFAYLNRPETPAERSRSRSRR